MATAFEHSPEGTRIFNSSPEVVPETAPGKDGLDRIVVTDPTPNWTLLPVAAVLTSSSAASVVVDCHGRALEEKFRK